MCMKTARLIKSRGAAFPQTFPCNLFQRRLGANWQSQARWLRVISKQLLHLFVPHPSHPPHPCPVLNLCYSNTPRPYNSLLQMPNYLNKIVLRFPPQSHHQNDMGLMHLQSVKDMES